jgi:hypothetical protein
MAKARPMPTQAQPVWNSLSLMSFRSVKSATATPSTALMTAVGQPRIEKVGSQIGRSSQTIRTAVRKAAKRP